MGEGIRLGVISRGVEPCGRRAEDEAFELTQALGLATSWAASATGLELLDDAGPVRVTLVPPGAAAAGLTGDWLVETPGRDVPATSDAPLDGQRGEHLLRRARARHGQHRLPGLRGRLLGRGRSPRHRADRRHRACPARATCAARTGASWRCSTRSSSGTGTASGWSSSTAPMSCSWRPRRPSPHHRPRQPRPSASLPRHHRPRRRRQLLCRPDGQALPVDAGSKARRVGVPLRAPRSARAWPARWRCRALGALVPLLLVTRPSGRRRRGPATASAAARGRGRGLRGAGVPGRHPRRERRSASSSSRPAASGSSAPTGPSRPIRSWTSPTASSITPSAASSGWRSTPASTRTAASSSCTRGATTGPPSSAASPCRAERRPDRYGPRRAGTARGHRAGAARAARRSGRRTRAACWPSTSTACSSSASVTAAPGNDPLRHGLDRCSLQGKLLRLDVDAGSPYAIPADNGFAGRSGCATRDPRHRPAQPMALQRRPPERRRLHRRRRARAAGKRWTSCRAVARGASFGWSDMEGPDCLGDRPCDPAAHLPPAVAYRHDDATGHCAIIGGYAYRGAAGTLPSGTYLFGDHCSGVIWAVPVDELVAGTAAAARGRPARPGPWAARLVRRGRRRRALPGHERWLRPPRGIGRQPGLRRRGRQTRHAAAGPATQPRGGAGRPGGCRRVGSSPPRWAPSSRTMASKASSPASPRATMRTRERGAMSSSQAEDVEGLPPREAQGRQRPRPAGTAAAARPCPRGWSGGCARTTPPAPPARPGGGCPWRPSPASCRCRTRCRPGRAGRCPPRHSAWRRRRSTSARRVGWNVVKGPSRSASALRSRMLPKVPRIMTSWWPRRAPYELNSAGVTPRSWSHWPAGLQAGMTPAGEMWSVVTESPSTASTRAPRMALMGEGSA